MRGVRLIGCALAVAALFFVSNARADEYTKLTYLTFSGPVQLPGITLPGGTYMFKLADPDGGRQVLQVWDKEETKLDTTLLTIPDEKAEASDKPVVMFSERPAGQPQAIKSWFYPDERTGQEFVYPKSQAMQIAKENHASVLSYSDESVKNSDAAALHSAKIGRVDENGQAVEGKTAENHANSNTAVSNDNAANNQSSANTKAATTTAAAAATTAADNDDAASSNAKRAGATTARADTAQQDPAAPPAPRSNTAPRRDRAVGTSGTTAAPQSTTSRTLPKTASPLAAIELLSALSLLGGLGAHQLRKRTAESRG